MKNGSPSGPPFFDFPVTLSRRRRVSLRLLGPEFQRRGFFAALRM